MLKGDEDLMLVRHCDHCGKIIENNSKEVEIRIGGYIDSADLCISCVGKLMHIAESFLNGDDFVRSDNE